MKKNIFFILFLIGMKNNISVKLKNNEIQLLKYNRDERG